jgi:dolichyl-diphosphooligosaccharide--protein glycosyltransferase
VYLVGKNSFIENFHFLKFFFIAAIALSKTLDYYADTETSEMTTTSNDTTNDTNEPGSDNENDKNNRTLYDKAGKVTKRRSGTNNNNQDGEEDGNMVSSNIKTIVVICSKSILIFSFNINRIFLVAMMLMLFAVHCTWVTSNAYSSPSIVLASYNNDGSRFIIDDFREAYYWLRKNTPEKARVMSWWDYGYQIAGMGNRTVLVDNNTWNNSHIALVGKAMSSNETEAYKIMTMLDVDYILVIFGGMIGYSGDDINKFLWMVRIAEG